MWGLAGCSQVVWQGWSPPLWTRKKELMAESHLKMMLVSVVLGEREEGWGLKRFIGHSELSYNSVKNRQYLKDDRLCFRLTKVCL